MPQIDYMKTIKSLACSFALVLAGGIALAGDESATAIKAELNKVTTAEMPARAATLVAEAKPDSREAMAASVVKTAVKTRLALMLAVVGAVSQKSPETAPTVAATAAELQPKQATQIAQAAASAAPAKAVEIVKAVAKVLPKAHRDVAQSVAQVVPHASKEVMAGVPVSTPETASQPQAPDAANNSRAPTIGAPFVPYSTTPGNVTPGGGQVPVGGRDYARP